MRFYYREDNSVIKGKYVLYSDESIIFDNLPHHDTFLELNDVAYNLAVDTKECKILPFIGYYFGFVKKHFELPKNIINGEVLYKKEEYESLSCKNFTPIGFYRDDNWYMVGDEIKDSATVQIAENTLISIKSGELIAIYFKVSNYL